MRIRAVHPVLAAQDVEASLAFYRLLGFEEVFRDSPRAPHYAGIRLSTIELHLQWADPGQWNHPVDRPVYRFLVDDVDELFRSLEKTGVIQPATTGQGPWARPGDTPWGTREFHLWDPGKNGLQFYQFKDSLIHPPGKE